jgi:phage gp29-like protein
MARKPRRGAGRPRNQEKELTVMAGGQLMSWPGLLKRSPNGSIYELAFIDDLLTRRGFQIYREMLNDDQIKACLAFKKLLVTGRAWDIVPAGGDEASEENKKIADFVRANLEKVNWNRIQREILTALDFGFSVGEILWEVDEYEDQGPKLMLKDIKHRDPQMIRIDVDIHGNIKNFRQMVDLPVTEVFLPPEKVIHYAYQSHFSNHYGVSDLRAAYRAWFSKKFITQFWNVFLERFGQPLMMMKYPMGATPELKSALRSILDGLSTRTDILVPEGVIVELIEATRAGTAQYGEALTYLDIAISKALLVPALLGMGTDIKRGSDSQSRLHLRVLMKVVNDLSQDLQEQVQKSIVIPLVDSNFNDVKEYPDYKYQDYGEYEAVEIVDAINNMFNAGILDMDQDDVNYARSILGLPIREEGNEDEIMRAPPPPVGTSPNDPNASGAGAGKNNSRAQKGPSTRKSTTNRP